MGIFSLLYKFAVLLFKGIEVRVTQGSYESMQIVYISMDGILHITDIKYKPKRMIEFHKIHCMVHSDNNTKVVLFNICTNTYLVYIHFIRSDSALIFSNRYNELVEKYNEHLENHVYNRKCKYRML